MIFFSDLLQSQYNVALKKTIKTIIKYINFLSM